MNVSRCDIREDRDIPGQFSSLIQKYNISPDQLRIEITETAFAENPDLLISNTIKLTGSSFSHIIRRSEKKPHNCQLYDPDGGKTGNEDDRRRGRNQ